MKKTLPLLLLCVLFGFRGVQAHSIGLPTDDDANLIAVQDQPKTFALYQNYPNPFNPSTVIKFELKTRQYARVKVYNILGKEVATLKDETMDAGTYEVKFNAGDLPSGVYFYSLETRNGRVTRQMLLMK